MYVAAQCRFNMEQALAVLHCNHYDVHQSYDDLEVFCPLPSRWRSDRQAFTNALREKDKYFYAIKNRFVSNRQYRSQFLIFYDLPNTFHYIATTMQYLFLFLMKLFLLQFPNRKVVDMVEYYYIWKMEKKKKIRKMKMKMKLSKKVITAS